DKLGSIESGKLADLIAVKGNPIEDISVLENVDVVIKDGLLY
ncbi:MAG: amidohydrolase family protein, partial [Pseudomonadota bacterium]|nr:amidohydrolase family protein [Pseudomonadota bacterium]